MLFSNWSLGEKRWRRYVCPSSPGPSQSQRKHGPWLVEDDFINFNFGICQSLLVKTWLRASLQLSEGEGYRAGERGSGAGTDKAVIQRNKTASFLLLSQRLKALKHLWGRGITWRGVIVRNLSQVTWEESLQRSTGKKWHVTLKHANFEYMWNVCEGAGA